MRRILHALSIAMICAACDQQTPGEKESAAAEGIWNSSWRLQNLGGAAAVEGVEATLEFPEQGRVVGAAVATVSSRSWR